MEHCPINMRVVKSQLAHALAALSALSEVGHGIRLTDLAERLDVPKSSMQRLLQQLADEGWVEQDAASGFYRLTLRMPLLGQQFLHSLGIVEGAQAALEALARETKELARLTAIIDRRLVWVASAQGAPPGLMYQPAMSAPIVSYATANGKAWLATLPPSDAERIAVIDGLGRPSAAVGPNAHKSISALARDLAAIRKRGYALAEEEAEPGVTAIAVVVVDQPSGRPLGTTSIAGPVVRLPSRRYDPIARELQAAASALARVWPYRPAAANTLIA
jgi:DNA-binding IclR family transcriptional regulator